MANLIEQMNTLKGLDDSALQNEVQMPSGAAPPFLVLTEINRRKDMRQRFDAQKAKQKPSTTVAEDITFGLPAAPPSVAPGGLGDAAAQAGPAMPGFANGGLVDAAMYADGGPVGYSDIAGRYNERLSGLSEDKDRARALALLAASAGILGGGSSNTLKNVGAGIGAFAGSYGDALKTIDSQELDLLRGATGIEQLQEQFAASEADRALRQQEIGISRDRLNFDKKPAAVVAAEWYNDPNTTDEERAAYDKNNYDPNAVTNSERLADDLDKIYADAQKLFPITEYDAPDVAAAKQQKAQAAAYQRIVASRGKLIADEWAANQGLSLGDIVVGGAPDVVDEKDPLGLGL